ncbi:hypothetical protein DRE_06023 [Drechslerella stenobrocha 248]|uniref:Mis18 domain-containing protein n=1 Tax=Drechslerella stenobrocha 248 TaxID=1043628 RepID=W7I815_9PEZI|nr:hypothetical protein DRE_06023 [Drechslerella stenobrocha 248]
MASQTPAVVPAAAQTPFAIVCKHCSAHLVNSAAIDSTIHRLKLVVLSGEQPPSVSVVAKSRRGRKKASENEESYFDVNCDSCGHVVGRKYTILTRHPDIQDKITLSMEETESRSSREPGAQPASGEQQNELAEVAQDILQLKQFSLMLSEGQDALSAQVAQLSKPGRQAAEMQQVADSGSSISNKDLEDLKARLASLETSLQMVVKNQNRLMAQMRMHSKGNEADFMVEIVREENGEGKTKAKPLEQQSQQQQNLSPPPSVQSGERGDDNGDDDDRELGSSKTAELKSSPRHQPREANSPGIMEAKAAGAASSTPIVISDSGDGGDGEDGEYGEGSPTAGHVAKRARLGRPPSRGARRGRPGRPSTRVIVITPAADAASSAFSSPKAQTDGSDKDSTSASTGRMTRSVSRKR